MGKIRVLPEHVCNRIAAGEVIERPASVVKELVENALDAGALTVRVNIEKSGTKLIAVSDDGSGMDPDDALQCLEPHATSKIFTEKDILEISTFGFRGEAVPSIASIARFTIRTRQKESLEGTEVTSIGGKVVSAAPAGCAPGTEMIVKDLFFNTPARKKFLRSGPTEDSHIQESLMMLSLSNPHVSFELVMDGRKAFSSPASDTLLPRIRSFFGQEMEKGLMPLKYSASDIKVSGYIARHGFTRTSRREQRIFINGRPVEALPVYQGIRDGYGSLVEKGRFPPVLLFLRVDPLMIDVNVHPAKRDIRFKNPQLVSSVVSEAVRSTLRIA
ncbi:MAG: DNA mismatch repair endonuclease MutL, partial [Endomicrobiaceae bacterium]|nr:DNA mismatch repair endonuclease MutL [Endomicrobiaceae bacterium]